ncbi:hypothetical protein U1Q18_017014 [Sarracenia purpurea var. burkii]
MTKGIGEDHGAQRRRSRWSCKSTQVRNRQKIICAHSNLEIALESKRAISTGAENSSVIGAKETEIQRNHGKLGFSFFNLEPWVKIQCGRMNQLEGF